MKQWKNYHAAHTIFVKSCPLPNPIECLNEKKESPDENAVVARGSLYKTMKGALRTYFMSIRDGSLFFAAQDRKYEGNAKN